jgi:hypothetical protein
MANLIPLSKSSLIKSQKSAIIKSDKFLAPRIKSSSAIVKFSGKTSQTLEGGGVLNDILKKVIQIDKVLKDSLLLSKKENEKKRVAGEQKDFDKREKELEKNKPKQIPGIRLPSPPKMGFLDWIRNFITQTILGFFVVRLVEHLPKLLKVLPTILKVGDFFINVGGKLLDGLVTFVDKAYELVDRTRQFTKDIGGNGLAQNFDKFAGALSTMLDVAIIAALSTASMGDDGFGGPPGGGKKGFDRTGRRVGVDTQKRYAQRFGKDQFLNRFGKKNLINLGEKGGAKQVLKFVRPFTKRLPIIGGLLDFGLSVALGEPVGRAAFKAIGATLLGTIGAALGGPFAILTGLAGGVAGDWAGGALYDVFFGNKKPQGKTAKAAGGGTPATRGGRLVGGPAKRTLKKKKTPRTLRATPSKLKPGAAVGGEKKIKELYPEPKDKTKMNPFNFIKDAYEGFAKSKGLGTLTALAIKPLMGDKPSYADYKNAAVGINNWMNQSVGSGTLAYAGGGEVKMESLISGEDYSDVIAKSLQDSVAPQVDKTIQDLMRQMMLKQPTKEPDKTDPTIDIEEDVPSGLTKGQWGPLLDLIAGKESGGNYEAMYPSTTLPGATRMTIAEVARRATGAVGKYQQLPQYIVGRAKAAGLNPDKDLYSAENQEKIIINVNIKGRGGEKWLKGEISDEQFMQGLSQEFASLPNAQGKFYYSGQRSSMTPEKVKASLAKVKRGGYSQQELAESEQNIITGGKFKVVEYITGDRNHPNLDVRGHGLPSNYHDHIAFATVSEKEKAKSALRAAGIQIGSELRPGDPGYHGRNLAIDVPGAQWGGSGSIGGREFAGSKKVRSVLGIGQNAPRFHGGPILKTGNFFGHKGEFVIDKDSVDLFGIDFIDSINRIENHSQLVTKAPSIIEKLKAISGYTDYENPEPEIVYVEVPGEPVLIPMGGGGPTIIAGGGGSNYVNSNMQQTLSQIG